MSEPSAKSFLKLLEQSGIVEEDQLQNELVTISKKVNGRTIDVNELARHLIEAGLISKWHSEKLLAGKYRGFFLGKFKLLGHLGSGGMSSVYLARHRVSNQLRAIKVLPRTKVADKSYLDRFYLEARAAASLNHPNVVRIYDICNEGITHYMVMEYVEGSDLYNVVRHNGPLSYKRAVRYTLEAAEGLSHAHERELVHRDIKPANLLRTTDGNIKILDLGLALVNQDDGESLTMLYNEKVMGTADYLSPEQAVNSHNVDLRTDIYSLGCTLYFFLTGHPPFPKGTLAQRIAMHQTREPAEISVERSDCPRELMQICKKMMCKEAADRYQNCVEVKHVLNRFLERGFDHDAPVKLPDKKTDPVSSVGSALAGIDIETNLQQNNAKFRIETVESQASESSKRPVPVPSRHHRKVPPKWIVPTVIGAMLLVLIVVLAIASRFLN